MTQDTSKLQPGGQPCQSPLTQLLQLKAVWVSVAMYGIAAYLHFRGRNLTTDQNAELYQFVGMLFDAVSTTIIYAANQHRKSVNNSTALAAVVNNNAEVLDKATSACTSVARMPVDNTGAPAPLNPPTNVPMFSKVPPPAPPAPPSPAQPTTGDTNAPKSTT